MLGVDGRDVLALALIGALAGGLVLLRYRALLFATFDPEVADASGVRTARIDAVLMMVLALAILASLQAFGVTLLAAALVIPAVVARMLAASFGRVLAYATAIGAACGFVGMNLSYHLDVQSGPTIVLVGAALFALVFVATGARRLRTGALAGSA